MSPINKNYKISKVGPHVGLGTSPCGPSYLNGGTRRTTEQQGESTHPSPSQQLRITRRDQHLKNQSIKTDSIQENLLTSSSSWRWRSRGRLNHHSSRWGHHPSAKTM